MNLLPRSTSQFREADYWNSFFKKRGDKAFEWYGEYMELCDQIHKYVKYNDKILVVGCGNSRLSSNMYTFGYRDITNIDISPVAVKQLLEEYARNNISIPTLQMDATQMSFGDEHFSVGLDKGTLDALFTDDTPEVRDSVKRYLMEINRVLKPGGRFLCLSLLQEHIVKFLVDFFPSHSFMVRIVHCIGARAYEPSNEDPLPMPLFLVVATKFKALPKPILEYTLDTEKMHRVDSVDELINAVSSLQRAASVCNGLPRCSIANHEEVQLQLFKPESDVDPRYTIYVLDKPPEKDVGRYAVFIVPQGRETEWLFGTPEGRRKLQESANYERLAIVLLHSDQKYESLEQVQNELDNNVRLLAPIGVKDKIPYLSLGSDVGKRETLVTGFSKMSGEFRIEEVEHDDGKLLRRLIFMSNQSVVQSEALVKKIKPKGKKERKKIDIGYLACKHHIYMSIGVKAALNHQQKKDNKHVLIVGLGGGSLCTFLQNALPTTQITAVEIDPIMLEVAEQYFELKQNNRFHVVIDDGLKFLERCNQEDIKFDAILFDVDSKDSTLGMSCPPSSFLEHSVLLNVKNTLCAQGIFILNMVCRNEELRTQVLGDIKNVFPSICCYKLQEDVNEVVYCSIEERNNTLERWRKQLGTSASNLNVITKDSKFTETNVLDVTNFLKDLKI